MRREILILGKKISVLNVVKHLPDIFPPTGRYLVNNATIP